MRELADEVSSPRSQCAISAARLLCVPLGKNRPASLPVIAANRALLMALIATNFFGQNTAAIMATEAQYMEMWAQDGAAMYGYAGAASAASTLTPFTSPLQTTNPAGVGGQAAAVAQAAGTSASLAGLGRVTVSLRRSIIAVP